MLNRGIIGEISVSLLIEERTSLRYGKYTDTIILNPEV